MDKVSVLPIRTLLFVLAVHRPFYISICISILPTQHTTFICMYVCMYVCMRVCVCVCIALKANEAEVIMVYTNFFFFSRVAHGYLTGYSEDRPSLGAFQYRLMGFKDKPNDFYTRPFFQKAGSFLKGGSNNCLGSRNILKCQFDYVFEIFDMFPDKMKFFLSFNGKV